MLGGGVRAGSLVLVGGGPGLGKSTLLIQLAALIAAAPPWGAPAGATLARASSRVLYISGEESEDQLADRADRLQVRCVATAAVRQGGVRSVQSLRGRPAGWQLQSLIDRCWRQFTRSVDNIHNSDELQG